MLRTAGHYCRVEVDEATQYGLRGVSKYDFLQFDSVAREKAFKVETTCSAYRKAGIVPTDPEVILKQLIAHADATGDLATSSGIPQPPSRPGGSTGSVPTPRVYAKLLEYCGRLEEDDKKLKSRCEHERPRIRTTTEPRENPLTTTASAMTQEEDTGPSAFRNTEIADSVPLSEDKRMEMVPHK
ncbi:uncharacterized protein ATNIH1004_011844 [Aspergillus tanneri]|uniref:Uncharacterized protein n=1 Tax=Aspergillus tanneri TaxID=1220188 RepID=A0A5M9M4L6_9EURO|nr:uncharacterized protein ATNIH1004_011844 [Aspergillus tanneri]KAA8641708.1 hypothetical protein ATNIH1004_011844 [Aspergillus tanneri]